MPERDDLERKLDPEFDLLLRSALSTYADPGPDSGLAQRILGRIAAEGAEKRTRRWLPWAIALPAAAAVLTLIVLYGSRPMHAPMDRASHSPISRPTSATTRTELSSASRSANGQRERALHLQAHPRYAAIAAKTAPLPKLDVFPTPQPLTLAEQALAAYAALAPEPERQSLIEAQKQVEAPLTIAAIQIQPLEPPDHDGN